ncbi:hypothetical protein H920_01956 [Fukomys damarensis]|uniref:Uncharacterized protein n=1 Tax=Fukomys damarensis TaxID=885580 RepID=A0A091E1S1_FUKDA|nr:hypothetical protein H920_01956 [Fukomys damarensis]
MSSELRWQQLSGQHRDTVTALLRVVPGLAPQCPHPIPTTSSPHPGCILSSQPRGSTLTAAQLCGGQQVGPAVASALRSF